MSKHRISPESGWVNPSNLPKGPNGRSLCRWCGQEVPKGKRTFCSVACVHEHKLRSNPGYLRKQLFLRDRGVCSVCSLDTVVEEQRLALERRNIPYDDRAAYEAWLSRFKKRLGVTFSSRHPAGYWDADHVVPVVDGGGECGLDNLRTLCVPCHRHITAARRRQVADSHPPK